jgi:hypothetical protein
MTVMAMTRMSAVRAMRRMRRVTSVRATPVAAKTTECHGREADGAQG